MRSRYSQYPPPIDWVLAGILVLSAALSAAMLIGLWTVATWIV